MNLNSHIYLLIKALTRSGKAWFMSSSGYFLSSLNIWVTRLFFSTATRYNVKRKLSFYKKKPDFIIKCLFVKVGILLTCETHFYYRIISRRVDVWVHRTSLILLLLLKMPVPSQKSKKLCKLGNDHLTWRGVMVFF